MSPERSPHQQQAMSLKSAFRGFLLCFVPGIVGCSLEGYRYIVPEGYVGWVRIRFEGTNARPLPREGRFRIARFPSSGFLETSDSPLGGDAPSEWLYEDAVGRRSPAATQSGFGRGNAAIPGSTSSYCFIGTLEQYEQFGRPRLKPDYTPEVGPITIR